MPPATRDFEGAQDDPLSSSTRVNTVASYGQLHPSDFNPGAVHIDDDGMTAIDLGPLSESPTRRSDQQQDQTLHSSGTSVQPSQSSLRPVDRGALDGSLGSTGRRSSQANGRSNRSGGSDVGSSQEGSRLQPRAASGQLLIAVKDPVKHAESSLIPGFSGGYVLYRVDSRSLLRSYRRERNAVRRRFRDFVVRKKSINLTHPPYFVWLSCADTPDI